MTPLLLTAFILLGLVGVGLLRLVAGLLRLPRVLFALAAGVWLLTLYGFLPALAAALR